MYESVNGYLWLIQYSFNAFQQIANTAVDILFILIIIHIRPKFKFIKQSYLLS